MGLKILVADDDPHIREIIAQMARRRGHAVVFAADGAEALALALAERPDAITLDLQMPRLDGRDVASRLKRDPMTRRIPVLVVSAQSDDFTRELVLDMGADDFVDKPFDANHLISKLEYLVEKARAAKR
jgi:two-component system OmpR family response regulator